MKSFFKALAIIYALLCIVSAYLQFNDPDPALWIAIYLFAAIVSVLFVMNKLPYWVYLILFVSSIVGAYLFWPNTYEGVTIGEGNINNIEHARESLGLIIMAIMMLFFTIRSKKENY